MDQDYDYEGNNIVPCPLCLDQYCISKIDDNAKCSKEQEFIKTYKN